MVKLDAMENPYPMRRGGGASGRSACPASICIATRAVRGGACASSAAGALNLPRHGAVLGKRSDD